MRHRWRSCAGTTAAFAVAFTAFGAPPAWAAPSPDVQARPPIAEQMADADAAAAPQQSRPASASTGESAAGESSPAADESSSPPVGDTGELAGDVQVAGFDEARSREYFAVMPESIPRKSIDKVRGLDRVESVEVVDAAQVGVDGESTAVLGVDPAEFRNYAPEPSAKSDEIWQGIAEGRVALSDEAGKQREIDVGSRVDLAGAKGELTREVWTHATSGVAGIDALISRGLAEELGFPRGNAIIVSAPDADMWELQDDLQEALGDDASLQLLAEDPEPRPSGAPGEEVGSSTVETAIEAAKTRIGVPYVWGGESMAEGGYDCSGLVQWAFKQAGVSIPRVTHDQWFAGEQLDYSQARRGDLIFWRNDPTAPDYISHVAIYLGDGRMLESPRTGLDVRTTDVRFDNMAGVVRVHG
ncbi:C40 family peptidase [Streptomonospora litoralis]|uniref:Peptidoglycan endopeptidase RipA n=1 Tax=Streptomonospora litoralis TaxID=2498135 RepID=A0A4P6Q305_9ACTN|nr:C40 family peptidase [Streptomonospora litoralis]QBI53184.1 Peptidoglycan endopeptidase RipA precursor [Streptomonospora litoralis]